jgi:hypothetical protein
MRDTLSIGLSMDISHFRIEAAETLDLYDDVDVNRRTSIRTPDRKLDRHRKWCLFRLACCGRPQSYREPN